MSWGVGWPLVQLTTMGCPLSLTSGAMAAQRSALPPAGRQCRPLAKPFVTYSQSETQWIGPR
eukprot:14161446-Alexandrium_andersonii.AAC.1